MTGLVVATLIFWVFLGSATLQLQDSTFGVSDHPTTLEERDAIITRLARHAGEIYTQHDVAVVLHERQPNDFRHISKRDLTSVTNEDEDGMIRNVRLELASGSEINLQLTKRSLFDLDTQFIDNVGSGRVRRAMGPKDCYATGDVVANGRRQGSVSVATCSGLHGKAFSNGMEYYIHPVDHVDGEQHHVHLFSRNAPENKINPGLVDADDNSIHELEGHTENSHSHTIEHRRSVGEESVDDNSIHELERHTENSHSHTIEHRRSVSEESVDDNSIHELEGHTENSHSHTIEHRRSVSEESVDDNSIHELERHTENTHSHTIEHRRSVGEESVDANKRNVTRVVIEMAAVVDSNYWKGLQNLYPNREDETILLLLAGVSALYGDLEEYGYNVKMKVKLYEVWVVDPEGYNYQPGEVLKNIQAFCPYTKKNKYDYDLRYLFTDTPAGFNGWELGHVCTSRGCVGANTLDTVLTAHEIGHSIGLSHGREDYEDCPFEDKRKNFMDGVYRKTPCIKWELDKLFGNGGGKCLFEETRETKTSEKFANIPPVIPGQYHNPDAYCKYKVGDDYELFRPYDFRGDDECSSLMCINRNKDSRGYLAVDKMPNAPWGYTCGDNMLCDGDPYVMKCKSWDTPDFPIDKFRLDEIKRENVWSEWSQDWTPCSHTCGTGVQLKRRRCIFSEGLFLSPYCTGSPIRFRPCNEEPCPGEQLVPIDKWRQAIGDQICERFHKNNVSLSGLDTYLPRSTDIDLTYWHDFKKRLPNKSCFFTCVRNPTRKDVIDSIYPDGTPCIGSLEREKLGIKFRCVEGACSEFSGCPGNERKVSCGLCGENPDHCVTRTFDESDDPGVSVLKTLAVLPVGTRNIDINMIWYDNPGVYLYVYDSKGNKIFGRKDGQIRMDRFQGKFANATWEYSYRDIVKADGPIDQELTVKVMRIDELNPIREIFATYILP